MISKEEISKMVNDAMTEEAREDFDGKWICCSLIVKGVTIECSYDTISQQAYISVIHAIYEHRSPLLEIYISNLLPDLILEQENARDEAEKDWEDEMSMRQELEYQFWAL